MKYFLILLVLIGFAGTATIAYVWAQDVPWHHYDDCLEMGKLPKVDKINDDTYMFSCIGLNPFEK